MPTKDAKPVGSVLDRIARMQKASAERSNSTETKPAATEQDQPEKPPASMRKVPKNDSQADFFVPTLYDVGTRDSRGIMDVAVFRLSKKDRRENAVIRYELPDGHVEVSSGVYGMASVWDYDIVLMAISHLTESMNRFREGKGEKPGQVFRPHVADVIKFCRRENGGRQKDAIIPALQRLSTTHVELERTKKVKGNKMVTINEGESLIGPFKTITNTATQKVELVEIRVADWMYREVTEGKNPDVLTVHPDYFLIDPGIGRFLYRLARRAAGRSFATWGFRLLYERSGSTGTSKEFARALRSITKADDLPEYTLSIEEGVEGPMLKMTHRDYIPAITPPSDSDQDDKPDE
ncbi:MAG: replication initiator protein A [Pseudomonadaceae bacterium]|nr:replication initiator protein A [Pseudomonadaceae bacterium]